MAQSFIWRGQSVFDTQGVGPGGKAECVASFRKFKRHIHRPLGMNYAACIQLPGGSLHTCYASTTNAARAIINEILHARYEGCEIMRNGANV